MSVQQLQSILRQRIVFVGFGIACLLLLGSLNSSSAYPQYQTFVEKNSRRGVNCALCHSNGDGPTGDGIGQLGGLTADEMKQLEEARTALQPGKKVNNPLLNRFGNEIVSKIGRTKVIQLMSDPKQLANELGDKSDLDKDGIPDAVEYLDGTDPLKKFHGDPWRLLLVNLNRYKLHLLLAALAVSCLNYGFSHLLKGFSLSSGGKEESSGEVLGSDKLD